MKSESAPIPQGNLEACMQTMPPRLIDKLNPRDDAAWETWVQQFLPIYQATTNKDTAEQYIRDHFPLRTHTLLLETFWEFGGEAQKETLVTLTHSLLSHMQRFYPDGYEVTVRRIKTSTIIPEEIKREYVPGLRNLSEDEEELRRNYYFGIILERMSTASDPSFYNTDTMNFLLKKVHNHDVELPTDPDFTKNILAWYGYDPKIRKRLRKIHKKHDHWSEKQTVRLTSNET